MESLGTREEKQRRRQMKSLFPKQGQFTTLLVFTPLSLLLDTHTATGNRKRFHNLYVIAALHFKQCGRHIM